MAGLATVAMIAGAAIASQAATASPASAVSAVRASNPDPSPSKAPGQTVADGHYCDGCKPPLIYSGGWVLDTSGDAGVIVTPIYWAAPNAQAIPAGYQQGINTYVADVAADSGTDGNVYSVATEYYEKEDDGTKGWLDYRITAGTPVIDTAPLPASGCKVARTADSCITDKQIQKELKRVIAASGLTTGFDHFYPMFFAPGVETQDTDGSNSDSSYCGYHSSSGSGEKSIFWANEPYETDGCDGGQAPSGDLVTDGAIGTLSHELMEAMTDPVMGDDNVAWNDREGNEIADICSGSFGKSLGSTDDADPDHTQYNQVINGHGYYTQTEFSNKSFTKYGVGYGCLQREGAVPAAQQSTIDDVVSYATPNNLKANGTSTSLVEDSIGDSDGNSVVGDSVSFSTYAVTGTGACGTLSKRAAVTDDGGVARVTYTASTANVVCAVVALESKGGHSSTATIYQGTYRATSPKAGDSFPQSLTAGGPATTFTTTFTNRSGKPINAARVTFDIFPATDNSPSVKASEVRLSYSSHGADGTFTSVKLSGSTGEGSMESTIGKRAGITIKAHSTYTITYRISLARSVATSSKRALVSFEAYLDQVNAASGSTANIADTLSSDVRVVSN
jgi:hypothetical protein